jgi:hypothetical protein
MPWIRKRKTAAEKAHNKKEASRRRLERGRRMRARERAQLRAVRMEDGIFGAERLILRWLRGDG